MNETNFILDEEDIDIAKGPSDDDLRRVSRLATLQEQQEQDVARLEQQLKLAKDCLRKTQETDLPEAMNSAGIKEYTTSSDIHVELYSDYYANETKKQFPNIRKWLEENDGDDIIKRSLEIEIGKGKENNELALQVINILRQSAVGNRIDIKDNSFIHAQTLKAYVREQIANNVAVPYETFGVYHRIFTKITRKGTDHDF